MFFSCIFRFLSQRPKLAWNRRMAGSFLSVIFGDTDLSRSIIYLLVFSNLMTRLISWKALMLVPSHGHREADARPECIAHISHSNWWKPRFRKWKVADPSRVESPAHSVKAAFSWLPLLFLRYFRTMNAAKPSSCVWHLGGQWRWDVASEGSKV